MGLGFGGIVAVLALQPVTIFVTDVVLSQGVIRLLTVGEGFTSLLAALAGVVVSSGLGAGSTRCLVGIGGNFLIEYVAVLQLGFHLVAAEGAVDAVFLSSAALVIGSMGSLGFLYHRAAACIHAYLPVVGGVLLPVAAGGVTQRIAVGEGITALLATLAGEVVSRRIGAIGTRCLVDIGGNLLVVHVSVRCFDGDGVSGIVVQRNTFIIADYHIITRSVAEERIIQINLQVIADCGFLHRAGNCEKQRIGIAGVLATVDHKTLCLLSPTALEVFSDHIRHGCGDVGQTFRNYKRKFTVCPVVDRSQDHLIGDRVTGVYFCLIRLHLNGDCRLG